MRFSGTPLTPARHLRLAVVFWRVCADLGRIVLRRASVPTKLRISHLLYPPAKAQRWPTCSQSAMSVLTLLMRRMRSLRTAVAWIGCNEVYESVTLLGACNNSEQVKYISQRHTNNAGYSCLDSSIAATSMAAPST